MRTTVVTMSDLNRVHPRTPHHAWKATSPAYVGDGVFFFCHHSSVARSYALVYFRRICDFYSFELSGVKVRRAPEFDRYLLKDPFGRPYQAIDIQSLTEDITRSE